VKRTKPQDMSVTDLVEHFVAIALAQDKALLWDETNKYNRLYDQMEIVRAELKNRESDQRRALLPLFDHPNAQVRLKAAIATLSVAPELARRVLQSISEKNEYPQAVYARGMLRALDEGTYKPS
jgi:hypothetical protein